jgi:ATP-binding cassette, subfamily B, multidrug efflux pump
MKEKTFRKLIPYLGGKRILLPLSAACAVLGAAGTLAAPALIGKAIDRMVKGKPDLPGIAAIIAALAAVYLVSNLFQWLLSLITNRVSYLTARKLRSALFGKLAPLPLSFFDSSAHGDVISRFVNDVDAVCDGLLQGFAQVLSGAAMILGATVFMVALSPSMAVLVVVLTPLSILTARFVAKNSKRNFREQADIVGALNGYAEEMIEGRREVKAFGLRNEALGRFSEMNAELYRAGVRAQFYSSLANPSTRIVNNLTYAIVGVVGSLAAISGTLTVGGITSFLIYSTLFAKPFNDITNVLTQIQSAFAGARRVFAILDLEPEKPDGKDAPLPDVRGRIAFENVRFSYDKTRSLIEGLDLDIPYGSSVAIVGKTGAGKTTLVNLLMRFYDVDGGRISLGGTDIREFGRDELRRSFGMVLQDTWLFSGTVRENIAYSKPGASEAEIVEAARSAGAHDFIARLAGGYEARISDSGGGLSQGQKQLITIARVMLADPPMFILDEATSSIDTRTELHVQKALKRLTAGRTSFVIAHRLSTIRGADLILVLEDGRIVEAGSHAALLKANGSYARLYANRLETA